jgi:predicted RNase H-like nuclease (RuvC/YqgF family)
VDDIVTRLQRALDPDSSVRVDLWESICAAALDEIEQLRDELADYKRTVGALEEELNTLLQAQSGWGRVPRLEAEVARLTSMLESWGIVPSQ